MERFAKVMALFAVFVLTLYVFDKLQPTITTATKVTQQTQLTTYSVYEVRQLQWTFDEPMDYSHDESLINLSGGEAKLKLQTILKELKNQTPLTIPLKGGGEYKNKHEFESAAYSYKGTLKTLSFDADKPAQTSVNLKIRTAGTQQALERAEWQPKGKDYYTTSPQNISGEPNGYVQYKAVLKTDDDAKTPMLNSVTITYETEEYHAEAAISTKEYAFSRSVEAQTLTTEEELKGQTIKYEYSTDSGKIWKTPISGQILAAAANKITVKATLVSNKTETPVLKDLRLNYKISVCDEKWQANYSSCGKNNVRIKYYTDANGCGSTEDLPADNGTRESCDYCTPQWTKVNGSCRSDDTVAVNYFYTNSCCDETGLTSDCTIPANTTAQCDFCTPNWAETNSSCGKDDRIAAIYSDANNCYATTGLQSDNNKPQNKTYICDYCTPSFVCGSYSGCSENNQKTCVQVNDTNSCYGKTSLASDSYTRDYNEFLAACGYDNEKPVIGGVIAVFAYDTLTIVANVTDKSATTAVAQVIKDDKVVLSETLINVTKDVYTGTVNASSLNGAYMINVVAKDKYNNTAVAEGAAGIAIRAEKAVVDDFALNSSEKAVLRLTSTTTIELSGKAEDSVPAKLVASEHNTDIRNTTKPPEKKELRKYLEIEASEEVKSNISSATIRIKYSDEEVSAANVRESSLALYFYNETQQLWQQLSSRANTQLNYVEGNTTHLSLFGVFGNEQNQTINATVNSTTNATENTQQAQTQPSDTLAAANAADGEGAGAGAGKKESLQQNLFTEKGSSKNEQEITKAQESCSYNVAVEMEDKPSFVNKTSISAALKNTGTCAIENLEVKVNQPLDDYIAIENGKAAQLEPKQSLTFAIKSKTAENGEQAEQTAQGQPLQGFAVKEQRKTSTQKGKIIVTGNAIKETALGSKLPLQQEVPLNIEVYELEQKRGKSDLAVTITGLIVLAMLLTITYNRIIKFRRGDSGRGGEGMKKKKKEVAAESSKETFEKEEAKNEEERTTPKIIKAANHETLKFHESLKKFEEKFEEKENLRQQNLFTEKGLSKNEQEKGEEKENALHQENHNNN